MFEDGFTPSGNCDEPEGRHVYPDICKCKYDKKEQRRKLINKLASESLSRWGDVRPTLKEIKRLSE